MGIIKWEPSKEEMERVQAQFGSAPEYSHYHDEEDAIQKAIKSFEGQNDILNVLNKCALINTFYSTSIKTKFLSVIANEVASNSKAGKKFRESLAKKSISAVQDLTDLITGVTNISSYSFASKYCSFHNPDVYPIYDSYVSHAITYLNPKINDKVYPDFVDEIKKWAKKCKTTDFKGFDHYLWIRGKEIYDIGFRDGAQSKKPWKSGSSWKSYEADMNKVGVQFIDYRYGFVDGIRYREEYNNGAKEKAGKDGKWPIKETPAYQVGWKKSRGYIGEFNKDGSIYFSRAKK